jgi:hypothetical protein
MNAGTFWGKNTIDPSGRCIEKPCKATLTFNLNPVAQSLENFKSWHSHWFKVKATMALQELLWHWIISCGERLYYQHWNFINWYSIYKYTFTNLHICPPEGWRCVRDYCSWAEDYTAWVWIYFTAHDLLNVKLTCRQSTRRLNYSLVIHCSPISERTLFQPRSLLSIHWGHAVA